VMTPSADTAAMTQTETDELSNAFIFVIRERWESNLAAARLASPYHLSLVGFLA
jgi:hypothetical protein